VHLSSFVFFVVGFEKSNALSKTAGTETEFDMKWPFKVILGHTFCNQLQAGSGLLIAMYWFD